MRKRVLVSAAIALASGMFCYFLMRRTHLGAGDFNWAIDMAQRWSENRNPYDERWQIYPLTAGFFGLPFVHVGREVAAGIFYGISTGLLAFGVTRHGYHRLLILLSYPYWIGLLYVQWSPLITASAFFPLLLPATMAKPQVGIPVFLTRVNKRGFWACVVFGIASLIAMPRWPMLWLGEIGKYQHFFALLVIPGPLILLALLRYRDRDSILLLVTACMPQRWFFDTFILWLIPKSRREILATVVLSWCTGIWRWYHPPHTITQVGRWIVVFTYLPMLVIILLRNRRTSGAELENSAAPSDP